MRWDVETNDPPIRGMGYKILCDGVDIPRVVTWINAVLARCRWQVRFPGGHWLALGPVKARLTIAVTA